MLTYLHLTAWIIIGRCSRMLYNRSGNPWFRAVVGAGNQKSYALRFTKCVGSSSSCDGSTINTKVNKFRIIVVDVDVVAVR